MWRTLSVVTAALVLAACAHTTNRSLCDAASAGANPTPCAYDPLAGYRFNPLKDKTEGQTNTHRDTLVFLSLSGGGVRASALAYGTIQALREIPSPTGDADRKLMDEVDVVSSVSGGSLAAGWLALHGQDGFPPAENAGGDPNANPMIRFMYDGTMGEIAARGLNPVALLRYAVTDYQRSDVLAEVFGDHLFKMRDGPADPERDATFGDVERQYAKPNQPFVILNATDMGHEARFPFTQNRFDLLCSGLSGYRLQDAVAASADFPFAFSAVGLQNFSSGCPARHPPAEIWMKDGPPRWISTYARFSDTIAPSQFEHSNDGGEADGSKAHAQNRYDPPRSNGLLALRAAREANDYIDPVPNDTYVHLQDGGIADNLGIQSTLQLEDRAGNAPGLFQRLKTPRGCYPEYGKITHVLFVVMNARSRSPVGIDQGAYPPDVFSTGLRVIDTSLDNSILDVQNYLTAELQAITQPSAADSPSTKTQWIHCEDGWMPVDSTNNTCVKVDVIGTADSPCIVAKIVAIDFELIPDKACRDHFWQIGTVWTLDKEVIRRLIMLPEIILRRSEELNEFYDSYAHFHRRDIGDDFKKWRKPPDLSADPFAPVCDNWPKGS